MTNKLLTRLSKCRLIETIDDFCSAVLGAGGILYIAGNLYKQAGFVSRDGFGSIRFRIVVNLLSHFFYIIWSWTVPFFSSVSNHNLPFKKIINCNLNNIRRKKKKEVQKEAGNCIYIFKKMSKIVYNAGRRLRSSHTCLSKSNNLKRPSLLY